MINKSQLRKFYKSVRKSVSLDEKHWFDNRILSFLINSQLYKNAETILIYVSFNDEVDTFNIIKCALSDGKKVAVPYCLDNEMNFLVIKSTDDLSEGKFGIPTADPNKCVTIDNFCNAICVVPALSFDMYGNRLGYGGGFYDRFLSKNNFNTVGLSYERCISTLIPSEKYDVKIKCIITENGLRNL